ncbi:MAG: 16S rRNA (guanine(527)-N(7))-methyltransferase RsmG [Candidatus Izemoplasmatales bacterium]|nr:16S rRNA (guanine(527)-N(7))-methyltransferase RsmG [Candidatus Izemoplasmatales bacterium]MDD5293024.1 16S rRNA (guanine(527)-N(7))-methyltransferase RsmG [Candidatus Izemoplasmatales bacterium]
MNHAFIEKIDALQLPRDTEKLAKLERYYEILVAENQKMNLTSITLKDEVYTKHFYDSLTLSRYLITQKESLLDVGSGAGFPALPLKIFFPELKVTMIDATRKKIDFLTRLTQELRLDDVRLIHGRVEDFLEREGFDLVVARAVARLNVLQELCLPFVRVNGKFLAMKAMQYAEELIQAANGTTTLGGRFVRADVYHVQEDLQHAVLVFEKLKPSPRMYPRSYAKIKNNPL